MKMQLHLESENINNTFVDVKDGLVNVIFNSAPDLAGNCSSFQLWGIPPKAVLRLALQALSHLYAEGYSARNAYHLTGYLPAARLQIDEIAEEWGLDLEAEVAELREANERGEN